jgi:hypothetical protein
MGRRIIKAIGTAAFGSARIIRPVGSIVPSGGTLPGGFFPPPAARGRATPDSSYGR